MSISWLITGEGEMFLEKKEPPSAGLLDGVMEGDVEYQKGEGRLEWLERKLKAAEEEGDRLRAEQAELLARVNELLRTQIEMNRRLADLEKNKE